MKRIHQWAFRVILLALGVALFAIMQQAADSVAQDGSEGERIRNRLIRDDTDIPAEALLTDRGRQLAQELRSLERTRSNLGVKHPSLPVIDDNIDAIKRELKAWASSQVDRDENPFIEQGSKNSDAAELRVDDQDLRRLVLRLNERIDTLERRVKTLERTLK